MDNFREAFSDVSYFEMMKERGQIEIAPLSYIRGRTFNDSFIIVDEAQNGTIHELKTIITRVGKNSKIVLLGDTDQVDTPYIDTFSNGLTIVTEKFKDESLAGHVRLTRGERSKLATLASSVI
jgi:PhoH-like ATPase